MHQNLKRIRVPAILSLTLLASVGAVSPRNTLAGPAAPIEGASPVVILPEPSPHWVYLIDHSSSLVVTNITVVDGDAGKVVGTISSSFLPNFVITPDAHTIYVSETYWSRGTRGVRSDMITAYSPRTLVPSTEVELPSGRLLANGKKYGLSLSADGHYLFSANMRPGTSVSVIDLKNSTWVTEIETPGCFLAYPTGVASFASVCGNGALMNVSISATGEVRKAVTRPFFNPERDPVFDAPAMVSGDDHFYFVSYHGQVWPVTRVDGRAEPGPSWNILTEEERRSGWRPGGFYQLLAVHAKHKRLFVLMHQGGEWTHKQYGTQVWVVNTETGRVVRRDSLVAPASSIAVTLDDDALLFAINESTLSVYRIVGDSLRHVRDVKNVGASFMSVLGEG
jgi:methylamine dehydrogenase heavy chain